MAIKDLIIPNKYVNKLNDIETQRAIKYVKDTFEKNLSEKLNLMRVSAPLYVRTDSGLNDNLNGVERPVSFDIKELKVNFEIVHSLAKWKRLALARYKMPAGRGLYTDMNAIRRDEDLDNLHSVYVDQWDWEKVICKKTRNLDYLKDTVRDIVYSLKQTENSLHEIFDNLQSIMPDDVTFITSQELEDLYPDLSSKQRESEFAKIHKCIFILQIGDILKSGNKHDGRAPDYDDWSMNGDLLVYYPILDCAVEISSMGIRVDAISLREQLKKTNTLDRANLPFHSKLLNNELPLTMGGGIGQSRICLLLLNKAHIGEVQESAWSNEMRQLLKDNGINLL